jgi:hypothetical protein
VTVDKKMVRKKGIVVGVSIMLLLVLVISSISTYGAVDLTDQDFSGLSYTDTEGDQYTHYQKFAQDSSEEMESYGVKGKKSKTFDLETSAIDIVNLKAILSSGTVTITIELATDILYGMSVDYRVYFVKSTHQQPDDLLNPKDQKTWMAIWDKVDTDQSLITIEFDYDDFDGTITAYSSPDLSSLTAAVDGNIITYTVEANDLEAAGLAPGSGFGLYAYAHLVGSTFGDPWEGEHTWDTAGVGAAAAPGEFNTELYGGDKDNGNGDDDNGSTPGFEAVSVIICVLIFIFILKRSDYYLRR